MMYKGQRSDRRIENHAQSKFLQGYEKEKEGLGKEGTPISQNQSIRG